MLPLPRLGGTRRRRQDHVRARRLVAEAREHDQIRGIACIVSVVPMKGLMCDLLWSNPVADDEKALGWGRRSGWWVLEYKHTYGKLKTTSET